MNTPARPLRGAGARGTWRARWAILLLGGLTAASPLAATPRSSQPRERDTVAAVLARADAAWTRGDRDEAERAYAEVISLQPTNSRALYRLAHLGTRSPAERADLLRRYVALEPADAWGYLALAQALADGDGDARRSALDAYEQAARREPSDRDIALGRPRLLTRLGRDGEAVAAYKVWLEAHPTDADVWQELADTQRRAGQLRSAVATLRRALALRSGDAAIERRIDALSRRTAPALEVGLLVIGETDVATFGGRVSADVQRGDSARVGVTYRQLRVESFDEVARAQRLGVQLTQRPRRDVRVSLGGGLTWTVPPVPSDQSQQHLDLGFRLRWTPTGDGTNVDVRGDHGPVDVNPDVIRADLQRTQGTVAIDAPVSGSFRLRGVARVGVLRTDAQTNLRTAFGGGPALRVSPGVHVGAQWQQVRYREPAVSGYFAPRLIDQLEGGVDLDRDFDRVSVGLDAGAGWHRFERHGAPMGPWAPAFRAWSYVGWTLRPGTQLLIESEAYSTRIAEFVPVSATAERWRYVSVFASLRFALR